MSKYIAEDSAVLFLNEADYNKYKNLYPESYPTDITMLNKNQKFFIKNNEIPYLIKRVPSPICDWGDYTKVSIIIQSIHSQNIDTINNIAKDLKENYGVEYVEVVATHCLLKNKLDIDPFYYYGYMDKGCQMDKNINKIITTNSTGILEPQKNMRLEVIDCEEFFNEVNL